MTTLTDLIRKAIALLSALWTHNQTLQDDNTALRATVADLHADAVAKAASTAALQDAKAAALAHDTATQEANSALTATVNDLTAQQADLAAAITTHPDVPITVAPDLTVTQDKGLVFPAPPVEVAPAPVIKPDVLPATDILTAPPTVQEVIDRQNAEGLAAGANVSLPTGDSVPDAETAPIVVGG